MATEIPPIAVPAAKSVLLTKRFRQRRAYQLHPIPRHYLFHLGAGAGGINFGNFTSHFFKELLKSTGLTNQKEFSLGIASVHPDVGNVTRKPNAGIGRQNMGLTANSEKKSAGKHVVPLVFAIMNM